MTQVLITRPLEPARQLAGQLRAHGLSSIVMPLYTFSPMQPSGHAVRTLADQGVRRLAVFTSPRAVLHGVGHIPAGQNDEIEFAAIGDATRKQLEEAGHRVDLQSRIGFTSEDFLQLPELARNPGQAIIFCAPGGREALASGLQKLNWSVCKAMVYERVAVQPSPAHIEAIDTASDLLSVWTSISALELAEQALPARTWDRIMCTPALVISKRIQHHLQQSGASRVELASGPGNEALSQSILRLVGGGDNT